ncbi:hypothetical protein J4226_03305 [Candidatus Pacearchaeota archaeon]|nr:hypothetical protein [Candidatus Pacearchaeota archaeon]
MNSDDKILIGVGVVLLIVIVYFGLGFGETTGEVVVGVNESNGHHTVAVCDENNYCRDFEVVCENGTLVEMTAIEGADYQHGEDWVDPRGNHSLCEWNDSVLLE